MIDMRRAQLSFGDGLIAGEVSDLREDWMKHADVVLADEAIVATFASPSTVDHSAERAILRREVARRLESRTTSDRRLALKPTAVSFC